MPTSSSAISEPARAQTQHAHAQVVQEVDAAEERGDIGEWSQEGQPEHILAEEPARGEVVSERVLPALDAVELTLGNGMRVTFRPSQLMDDQILLSVRVPPARARLHTAA